jgi:peptide/nickel transport system substrate-binding protein
MRRSWCGWVVTLVALAAAMCAAPACAGASVSPPSSLDAGVSAASPAAVSGDETLALHVGVAEEIDGLNPFSSWSGPTWEMFRLNYNFLTWYDDEYDVAPDLATSWEHDASGRVWTFHLRDDVVWQDGEPLTASDVAFTYNLIIDNDLAAYTGYLPFVTDVVALDDVTVRITNSKPAAGMLALYIPILPEHIWSAIPADKLDSWKNVPCIGSGPFQVVEVQKSDHAKLVANKRYFEGAPTLDEVWFDIYQAPDTAVQDFKAGKLDVVSLSGANFVRSLQGISGTTAGAFPSNGFVEMGFNCWKSSKSKGDPSLLDPRVRQAIHWCIDKQKLVDVTMGGVAEPGTSVEPPLMPWHWQPTPAETVSYDPEKAKQLLDAAGYRDVNGDGRRETPNGAPWNLRLTPLTDYPEQVSAAKMVSDWMTAVGIDNTLDPMEEGAFYDVNWAGDFDIYFWSWGVDLDPGFILSVFTTDQIHSWSDCYYSNPVYDKLYYEQASAYDLDRRREIVNRMQKMLYTEAPYVILWYYADTMAYRTDTWTGWSQAPPGVGPPIRNFMRTTYLDLRPTAAGAGRSGGASATLLIVIGAAAVAIVVAIAVVVRRRPAQQVEH